MPGFIKKKLREYGHLFPERVPAQAPLPTNTSPPLDAKGIKKIQQIVGSILYYTRVVDMSVLTTLSLIAMEQTKATEITMYQCIQLLDYLASSLDAKSDSTHHT